MIDAKQQLEIAVKAVDSKRGADILALDLGGISFIADTYLIADAPTERQVLAIADEVISKMAEAGVPLISQEGRQEGQWVLLDFGDLLVHLFKGEARGFYNLEKLWGQAPEINISDWLVEEDY